MASDYTKLLFCTTGVLLHRLVKQKSIDNINYIVLDEVHERDKDMDFLMIVIKKLMRTNAGKTHVSLLFLNDIEIIILYLLYKFYVMVMSFFTAKAQVQVVSP